MDIEYISSNDEKSENSDSENQDENLKEDEWLISYDNEKNFWLDAYENNLTYVPEYCPACNSGVYQRKESIPSNLNNPFYLRCNYSKCRKMVTLRNYSFFKLFRNTPASIIYLILESFILKRKNAKEIFKEIQTKFNKNISYINICKKLEIIRKIICEFFKIKYRESNIGGFDDNNIPHIVALDESLFSHDKKGPIWVVGGVDTKLKNIRLDIIRQRNTTNLAIFVNNHFREGTHFTHDGWSGYNFLDNNINYTHETHNHGSGDFGYSFHSTSHIEAFWAELKKELHSIYGLIPMLNFVYFLREVELRVIIKKFNDIEKMNTIKEIIKKVYFKCNFKFSSISDLEKLNNYD